MNLSRYLLFVCFAVALGVIRLPCALAQVLIIESSDGHSNYETLPSFLAMVEQKRRAFLQRHSEGRVIVLLAGDVFGAGPWTRFDDRGWIGVRAIAELARQVDVLFAPGNHDAFDWGQVDGHNGLAHEQFQYLSAAGVSILAANVRWAPDAHSIGQSHRDFDFVGGRRLRVVGFTLSRFWDRTHAHENSPPSVIGSVRALQESLAEQVQAASRAGVTAVVPFAHEETHRVRDAISWVRTHEASAFASGLRMPVAFAAHDHRRTRVELQGTEILNASDQFSSWITELDRDLEVVRSEFLPGPSLPPRYRGDVDNPALRIAADAARSQVARVRGALGYMNPFPLRGSRGVLDRNLWDSAFETAMADLIAFAASDPIGAGVTVGIYGGKRPEHPFLAVGGAETLGEIAGRFAWGPDPIVAFRLVGEDFVELWNDLRSDFESPRIAAPLAISSNLRFNRFGIEIRRGSNRWSQLQPEESLLVAFDPRLFRVVGDSRTSWRRHLRGHAPEVRRDLYEAILGYGPAAFEGARWSLPALPPSNPSRVACRTYFAR